ncbi:MAG: SCO family protein [Fidelibacterota bacterium]
MSRRSRTWLYGVFGIVILVTFLLRVTPRGTAGPPVLGQLQGFSLVDQNGNPFSREDLLGHVWVVDFIFTTCAGPCPVMSGQFAELQERFSKLKDVRLLSISVNPEFDTPSVLKDYGARYAANHDRWIFLTGRLDDIHRLAADGFHVGSVEEPIFHSTRFILVDRNARIRGYYISTELDEMQKLWHDVRALSVTT